MKMVDENWINTNGLSKVVKKVYRIAPSMWQIAGGITLGLWGFTITSAVVWFGIVVSIFRG